MVGWGWVWHFGLELLRAKKFAQARQAESKGGGAPGGLYKRQALAILWAQFFSWDWSYTFLR